MYRTVIRSTVEPLNQGHARWKDYYIFSTEEHHVRSFVQHYVRGSRFEGVQLEVTKYILKHIAVTEAH